MIEVKDKAGNVWQVTMADAYSGPDNFRSGQNVNSTAAWIRRGTDGEWHRSPWRSKTRTMLEVEAMWPCGVHKAIADSILDKIQRRR